MNNVVEVVLFYSKFSKECGPCVQYIINNKLPVILIPLDNQEIRNRVTNGSVIQIKNVPSMLISYANNDVQLYVGSQKIIAWFSFMRSPPNNTSKTPQPDNNAKLQEYDAQNNTENKVQKKRKKKKNNIKHIKPASNSDDHTELIFEDDTDVNNTHIPSNLSSKISTSTPKPSPNEGIMAMAKQMAAERDRHLNIGNNENG